MSRFKPNLSLVPLILAAILSFVQPALAQTQSVRIPPSGAKATPIYDGRGFFTGWQQPAPMQQIETPTSATKDLWSDFPPLQDSVAGEVPIANPFQDASGDEDVAACSGGQPAVRLHYHSRAAEGPRESRPDHRERRR